MEMQLILCPPTSMFKCCTLWFGRFEGRRWRQVSDIHTRDHTIKSYLKQCFEIIFTFPLCSYLGMVKVSCLKHMLRVKRIYMVSACKFNVHALLLHSCRGLYTKHQPAHTLLSHPLWPWLVTPLLLDLRTDIPITHVLVKLGCQIIM